jgi:phospholipase/carboxylesterase
MNRLNNYLPTQSHHSSALRNTRHLDNSATNPPPCPLQNPPPQLDFPYRLFVPEHYESRYAYPLVLWLHSDHSSEAELDSLMPSLSLRNYVALALRGTRPSTRNKRLYRWGHTLAEYALVEECAFQAIEQITESLHINSENVFLAGFGHGGTLAQWIALRNPHTFAGAFACNSPFPNHKRALTQWKLARDLPVLAMQSSDSKLCDVDQVIDMMQLTHRTHLNYRFIRYNSPSIPTNSKLNEEGSLDTEMLRTANRFMMSIITRTEIELCPPPSEPTHTTQSQNPNVKQTARFDCHGPVAGN